MMISIVTGTYNRLESLKRMVSSVQDQIPRGLLYEFVIVDGGSIDGTLEWCRELKDIQLIEHGELRGAIKAFCDGARAATGQYVVLANDDITFQPLSILAAVAHLERHLSCGAVAFADNRTSLVKGDGTQYRVEGMGATLHDGRKSMVSYAQVGMFRKELGEAAGWWGDADPIMQYAKTYGGDNYLSSRIWEMGHSVDPVPFAMVEDHILRDGMRLINNDHGPRDSGYYYTRFPTVNIPKEPVLLDKPDRLRILSLPVYEQGYPGRFNREQGMIEALAEYGLAIEWDYLNDPVDLAQLVEIWQPDLLITQIQGTGRHLTPQILANMRTVAPNMVVVNWNGDAHEHGLTSNGVLDILKFIDLQTVINAKVLPVYNRLNIQAAYWQIGYKDPIDPLPDMPKHEVLWQGNCYNQDRDTLVRFLRSIRLPDTRPINLGMYGNCRGSNGNTHYNFAAQRALYQRATITVGDTFPGTVGFVSNRLFQALSAGAFLLQQYSPELQAYTGLTPGVHYIEWHTLNELRELIILWLKPESVAERAVIARTGQEFVTENFSYKAQVRKLFHDLLPLIEVKHEHA